MVRITKSKKVPAILVGKGALAIKETCSAFDKNPVGYSKPYNEKTNPYKFDFNSNIYGDKTVKEQLKTDQANKCCFCENKDFDDVAFGDVEHYRPKSAYVNDDTNKALQRPGYYWLAYIWSNLLFSCQICNQRHKKNYFPLIKGANRTSSHHKKLEPIKHTLLINPLEENPEKHIGFREEIVYHSSDKGFNSIKYYGLDRDKLDKKRRKHLEIVRNNIVLSKIQLNNLSADQKRETMELLGTSNVHQLQDVINTAIKYVSEAAKLDAAFSLMVHCNFKLLPKK